MRFSKLKLVVALPLFLGIVACDRNSVDQEQSEDQVDIGNSPELQAQDKITSKSMVEDKTIESSDDYFSYRRASRVSHGLTGRNCSVIALQKGSS